MKCKISSLCIAVLFCLAALPFLLSSTAFGQCGTNPLGDTSGDTEFYVSKNQIRACPAHPQLHNPLLQRPL